MIVTEPFTDTDFVNCMLHRQLTDEMNLELEQRRNDFEKRSRQLEEQSRFEIDATRQ